jgi:hypothetical protein
LASNVPAGEGKTADLFLQCRRVPVLLVKQTVLTETRLVMVVDVDVARNSFPFFVLQIILSNNLVQLSLHFFKKITNF